MSTAPKAKQLFTIQPLSNDEISYLKSSAPAVKEHGVAVTSAMYRYMFENFPEEKPYFNMTNQHTGRQPRVLAFALYAYISHLDDLTPISDFVHQIVVKHCGLDIRPEQYPVVGKCLIHAFQEVLGSAADDKFVATLGKAYGNLAQLSINAEEDYYQTLQWRGFKEFQVTKLEKECANVTSVYLTPKDGFQLQKPLPGQYVGIRWKVPGADEQSREYSISKPVEGNELRISVRHIPAGAISSYVNEQLREGDTSKVLAPVGNFVYDANSGKNKVALLAGGIGITPLISMAEAALAQGKTVEFFDSNSSKNTEPFQTWISETKEKYPDTFIVKEFISSEGRKLEPSDLKHINNDYDVYTTGPVGYMDMVKKASEANGVEKVKLEYFGPTVV